MNDDIENPDITTEEYIADEILNDKDVYYYGEGPSGEWYYRSLTVYRKMNTIVVRGVDGELMKGISVTEIGQKEDPNKALREALNERNKESLGAL